MEAHVGLVLEKSKRTFLIPNGNQKSLIVYSFTKNGMVQKLKNVNLLELSETYRRVLYSFFSFPEQAIGLNDLSEQIGASKTGTKAAVAHLLREGFLNKEEVGNAWRLSALQKRRSR